MLRFSKEKLSFTGTEGSTEVAREMEGEEAREGDEEL